MVWKFYWLIVVFYEEYGFYRSILYQQLDNVNDVSKEAVMHTTFTFFHHAGGDHHLNGAKMLSFSIQKRIGDCGCDLFIMLVGSEPCYNIYLEQGESIRQCRLKYLYKNCKYIN